MSEPECLLRVPGRIEEAEGLNEEQMTPARVERQSRDVSDMPLPSEGGQRIRKEGTSVMTRADQWRRVRARLHAELGEATFNSWFKQVDLIGVDEGRVILAVPTRFIRNWIASHYVDRLAKLWEEEDAALGRVDIVVHSDPRAEAKPLAEDSVQNDGARAAPLPREEVVLSAAVPQGFEDAGVGAPLDPRFTFDAFVVGKSNELAHAAARRVAEATDVTFNPLFLYGGVGLGKTHLMHAIAWEIRKRHPERKVLYLSAEKFMYQF
ncbi:MAG TPA: chromosomal replication initiator protein DnaA, partial [Rhodobiaceae bacterium]|nr:chromosomal replication initiator protein DnaA [Rhodobiaceae bacterium]